MTGLADHVLKSIPKIENDYSIFELGCGTGAILKHIRDVYGPEIKIGGSDLSFYAIEKIRKVFPKDISQFHVISMIEKNSLILDNSQDIILSFGAFAMYLYKGTFIN